MNKRLLTDNRVGLTQNLVLYKITDEHSGQPLILETLDEIQESVNKEYGEVGDKYQIELIEMTLAEFKELPEWGGF